MTIEEFLEELKEAAPLFTWYMVDDHIMGDVKETGASAYCPLMAVRHARIRSNKDNVDLLTFSRLAMSVIAAADNNITDPRLPEMIELRKQMLKICGLVDRR